MLRSTELPSMAKIETTIHQSPSVQRAFIEKQWEGIKNYPDHSLGNPIARIQLLTSDGRKRIGLSAK